MLLPSRCLGCPNTRGCHSGARGAGLSRSRLVMLWRGNGSHGDAGWQRVAQAAGQCSPRDPVSLGVAAVPLLRKCYSSGVLHREPGGGRVSHSAFPTMNKHRHSFCPNPVLGRAAEQGQERRYFWGSFAASSLLKQHHVPDRVCGNHQTLTGAACSHRNTGRERAN